MSCLTFIGLTYSLRSTEFIMLPNKYNNPELGDDVPLMYPVRRAQTRIHQNLSIDRSEHRYSYEEVERLRVRMGRVRGPGNANTNGIVTMHIAIRTQYSGAV